MPTYEELVKTTDGLEFAKDVFAKAKPGYHPITTGSVEKTIAEAKSTAATVPAAAPEAQSPSAVDAAEGEQAEPAETQ